MFDPQPVGSQSVDNRQRPGIIKCPAYHQGIDIRSAVDQVFIIEASKSRIALKIVKNPFFLPNSPLNGFVPAAELPIMSNSLISLMGTAFLEYY
jgi:hypothetical protein